MIAIVITETVPICVDRDRADRNLAIEIGEIAIVILQISREASIAIEIGEIAIVISPITIAISPRKCDIFWVLFVFLGMNDNTYSFGNWENVSNK